MLARNNFGKALGADCLLKKKITSIHPQLTSENLFDVSPRAVHVPVVLTRLPRRQVSLTAVRRQTLALLTLVAAVYWYVDFHEQDPELAKYRLGFMAASASIGFSASPLASVVSDRR